MNNGFIILPGTMVLSATIGQFDRPHGNTSVTRIVPETLNKFLGIWPRKKLIFIPIHIDLSKVPKKWTFPFLSLQRD